MAFWENLKTHLKTLSLLNTKALNSKDVADVVDPLPPALLLWHVEHSSNEVLLLLWRFGQIKQVFIYKLITNEGKMLEIQN